VSHAHPGLRFIHPWLIVVEHVQLMEITGTRISVSSISDVYPGTQDRIVLITGDPESVNKAQELLWDLIGSNTHSKGDRSVPWNPRTAQEEMKDYDGVSITGRIAVSASAGGLLLGKGGKSRCSLANMVSGI
jgi:hypothetical protein